jgi:hypothetical protein
MQKLSRIVKVEVKLSPHLQHADRCSVPLMAAAPTDSTLQITRSFLARSLRKEVRASSR